MTKTHSLSKLHKMTATPQNDRKRTPKIDKKMGKNAQNKHTQRQRKHHIHN